MVFMAVGYMGAPAFATLIVQKLIYKEPLKIYGWNFSGKKTIRYSLLAGLFGALLVPGALGVSYLLGNELGLTEFGTVRFSEEGVLDNLSVIMSAAPQGESAFIELLENGFPVPVWLLLPISLLAGILSALTFNLPFMFGEEFGWRGLLLQETRQMGLWKNTLFIGVVWGLWHAPIILMGHNYPSYPVGGIFMMCLLTSAMCIPFAYTRMKSESILAPCVLHGTVNGTAGAAILFHSGGHELVGSIVGLAGVLALLIISFGIVYIDKNFAREYEAP